MSTLVQARDAIVGKLNTAFTADKPTLKVFWENATQVDLNTAPSPFLLVEIDFVDSVQADMGATPITRHFGEVTFRLFAKEGQGTRGLLSLTDYLMGLMSRTTVSDITLETPSPGRKSTFGGWVEHQLEAPFHFHS